MSWRGIVRRWCGFRRRFLELHGLILRSLLLKESRGKSTSLLLRGWLLHLLDLFFDRLGHRSRLGLNHGGWLRHISDDRLWLRLYLLLLGLDIRFEGITQLFGSRLCRCLLGRLLLSSDILFKRIVLYLHGWLALHRARVANL